MLFSDYYAMYPSTLFECFDQIQSMHFVFALKNTPENEETNLMKIVRYCGGETSNSFTKATDHSIVLVDHNDTVPFGGPAFTLNFLKDCLNSGQLQDISDYRNDATKDLPLYESCMSVVYFKLCGWKEALKRPPRFDDEIKLADIEEVRAIEKKAAELKRVIFVKEKTAPKEVKESDESNRRLTDIEEVRVIEKKSEKQKRVMFIEENPAPNKLKESDHSNKRIREVYIDNQPSPVISKRTKSIIKILREKFSLKSCMKEKSKMREVCIDNQPSPVVNKRTKSNQSEKSSLKSCLKEKSKATEDQSAEKNKNDNLRQTTKQKFNKQMREVCIDDEPFPVVSNRTKSNQSEKSSVKEKPKVTEDQPAEEDNNDNQRQATKQRVDKQIISVKENTAPKKVKESDDNNKRATEVQSAEEDDNDNQRQAIKQKIDKQMIGVRENTIPKKVKESDDNIKRKREFCNDNQPLPVVSKRTKSHQSEKSPAKSPVKEKSKATEDQSAEKDNNDNQRQTAKQKMNKQATEDQSAEEDNNDNQRHVRKLKIYEWADDQSAEEDNNDNHRQATKQKVDKHTRKAYTHLERCDILKYIVHHKEYSRVKGRELWMTIERRKVCPSRTWQSMKEHFLKKIVKDLNVYPFLSDSQKAKIKYCLN